MRPDTTGVRGAEVFVGPAAALAGFFFRKRNITRDAGLRGKFRAPETESGTAVLAQAGGQMSNQSDKRTTTGAVRKDNKVSGGADERSDPRERKLARYGGV